MKRIFILIGPKGSGKSYIGQLLEKELSLPFLRVEPLFLKVKRERLLFDPDYVREGFVEVKKEIRSVLQQEDTVMFETTGACEQFGLLLTELRAEYCVKLIRIETSEQICRARFKARSPDGHVGVSDEEMDRINQLSAEQQYQHDGILYNVERSDREIIDDFIRIIS